MPRALCLPSFLCWFWRIRGHARGAISFFLLFAFCHLADLRFSFYFLSFWHQVRVLRAQQSRRPTLQLHPRPAPRREHRQHSSRRSFSVDGDSGSGSQASTLRQQGNFAEEHAAVAVVMATLRLRQGCRQASDVENRGTQGSFSFSFLTPNESRRPSPCRERCLPSPCCCLPRIRGRANAPLLFFPLSTRFATSLTFVFRSFSSASPRIKHEFSGPSRAFPPMPTHSPATSSPCSSTRAPSALGQKIFLRRRGDSGSSSQASTLRQQGNFAEKHAAFALIAAAKKKRSVSDTDIVKHRA